jgi:ankyrin repeat protein
MDIFEAARTNNIDQLIHIVTKDNINTHDERGSTALILAAYHNNLEVSKYLLEQGADTEARDKMGYTALMGASFKGYAEMVKLLIGTGASIEADNGSGSTALTFAATFGKPHIVNILMAHGASADKKTGMARVLLVTKMFKKVFEIIISKFRS